MDREKRIRRSIWLDEWQFEQTESWLSAMAEKGWRLEKAGCLIFRRENHQGNHSAD
jgi:hypothetical protein